MTTYFHLASVNLAPGSVITPGNYGRILRAYTPGTHDGWRLATELAFENVRLRKYPDRISRLQSCFAFFDHADAHNHRDRRLGGGFVVPYEVELVDETAPRFVGSWTLADHCIANVGQRLPLLERIEVMADAYWRGENPDTRELLTLSPMRVLRAHP